MINTLTIKPRNGQVFSFGRGSLAKERILIVGSCRSVPYANYLKRYIDLTGVSLRVQMIDPNDWHWDSEGRQIDFDAALLAQEGNPSVLDAIRSADIYIHEHYASYGMFNSTAGSEKNIFQFGMEPRLNITIPNFHDHFILWNELMQFDAKLQELAARDDREAMDYAKRSGEAAVEKFLSVCARSSFPEMGEHFANNWRSTRFFWTGNHISRHFSLFIFRQMNDRFLNFQLSDEFWAGAEGEDLFAFPHTELSERDIINHQITWK